MLYLIEVSVCLAIFYLIYEVFFSEETFFQRNRYYLLYTSLLSLMLPLLQFDFRNDKNQVLTRLNELTVNTKSIEDQISGFSVGYENLLIVLYLSVAFILSARFLYQLYRIKSILNDSKIEYLREYKLVRTEGKIPTSSYMQYLFWDNSLELKQEEAEKILAHEVKHIRDRHTYDLIYIQIYQIFFWFNPIVYLYEKSLKECHEFIADNAVLTEANLKSYNQLIVQSLFKKLNLNLTHNFNQSIIKKRIDMTLKARTHDWMFAKMLLLLPLLSLLLFAFSNNTNSEDSIAYRNAEPEIGMDEFYKILESEIEYPATINLQQDEKVLIQFEIQKDGSIENIKLLKGFHESYNRAALEAFITVSGTQHWKPAKVAGETVVQKMSLPIVFKKNSENGK